MAKPRRAAAPWELPAFGASDAVDPVTPSAASTFLAAGSAEVQPRQVQRFQLIQHLGSGAMGAVYRAYDPQLDRDVAIKLLASVTAPAELSPTDTVDLRGDAPASADDLLREARIMARLSHPNLLPIYEVGIADGAVFLVMEYVDGRNLASWLARPRPAGAILELFSQVARGLAAAHAGGVVHRDIKPANILIGRDRRVRVADFGLSRLCHRPAGMVRIADPGGTPRYMAPELWRGEPATPASDVFALSTALLEVIEGIDAAEHVSVRLRELAARGTAEDPIQRPALGELIEHLEGTGRRWRRWPLIIAAGVAVAAAFGALAAMSTPGRSAPSCSLDPDRFAGRWDAARRAAVPAARATAFSAKIDRQQHLIDDGFASACTAARAGDLTRAQHRARESCLERR